MFVTNSYKQNSLIVVSKAKRYNTQPNDILHNNTKVLNVVTFCITTLSITAFSITKREGDIPHNPPQHNDTQYWVPFMLTVAFLVMLTVDILNVVAPGSSLPEWGSCEAILLGCSNDDHTLT